MDMTILDAVLSGIVLATFAFTLTSWRRDDKHRRGWRNP